MSNSAEIEAIVRAVLARLRQIAPASMEATSAASMPTMSTPAIALPTAVTTYADPAKLRLGCKLITLESLRDRLDGIKDIEVPARAVVTPAVLDELRRLGVSLQRLPEVRAVEPDQAIHPHAKTLVIGPREKVSQQMQTCRVEDLSQADALLPLAAHLESENNRGIWCTAKPFAAALATKTYPTLRAVQLGSLAELPQAIAQAQPNLLIADDSVWTVASLANLIRAWESST